MDGVHIIKGAAHGPDGKWDAVQAIQHEPFIYIQWNGSRWLGQEEGEITELLEVLANHKLGDFHYISENPCHGVENPDWCMGSGKPHYIDGPRMYAVDGVFRFCGNFETVSHAFGIDTNHKPTIDALAAAFARNRELFGGVPCL